MINMTKVATKLQAIKDKDQDAIVAKETHLPFTGKNYTKGQLDVWLRKVQDVLQDVLDGVYTEEQIDTFVANKYNGLSVEDKAISDDPNGDFGLASSASAYDDLRIIAAHKFIKE